MDGPRTPRDERRRAQHNEVERRRRDKINNWIVTLSKIIPDCNMDSTKTGASKGGILSKACDYIRELRQNNQRLQESLKEVERIQVDNELCRQQIEELKNENALLRAQLQQHGIEMVGETPPQWSGDREERHHSDIQPARWKRRRDDGEKNGLAKNLFLFSECILPWVHRSWTRHRPIGCTWLFQPYWDHHPLKLSRNVLQEKLPTHRHQSALLALVMKENLRWTPQLFCIYVASLMDYDVCRLILFRVGVLSPQLWILT